MEFNISNISSNQRINLIEYLSQFVTEQRKRKFIEILDFRTHHITVALENLYQSHNTSAVMRSCDCFGIQDVHVIENSNNYQINPDIALGSSNWLNIFQYNNTKNNTSNCIQQLKQNGYKVIATTPHNNNQNIHNLEVTSKIALLFGTEKDGLTAEALEQSDGFVKIPMYGFTESFNISVSAAICLSILSEKLRNSQINWHLTTIEKEVVMFNWLSQSIKNSKMLIKDFIIKNSIS